MYLGPLINHVDRFLTTSPFLTPLSSQLFTCFMDAPIVTRRRESIDRILYSYPLAFKKRGLKLSYLYPLSRPPSVYSRPILLSGILAKVNKPNKYILISHKHKLIPQLTQNDKHKLISLVDKLMPMCVSYGISSLLPKYLTTTNAERCIKKLYIIYLLFMVAQKDNDFFSVLFNLLSIGLIIIRLLKMTFNDL